MATCLLCETVTDAPEAALRAVTGGCVCTWCASAVRTLVADDLVTFGWQTEWSGPGGRGVSRRVELRRADGATSRCSCCAGEPCPPMVAAGNGAVLCGVCVERCPHGGPDPG